MRRVVPFVLLFGVFVISAVVRGQQTPQQTQAGLKPAAGLAATTFATEPMVVNPTDMTVDERGRVWVLEGVNYRNRGRNLPDPRPEGDRIVILEDTNNDGTADKSTVFDQGPHLRVPLGIAVLGDRVYLSQSPDITVYLKDANDKIIGKEVLLSGFGGVDHDHGLHAVQFHWDGKLYFNQGNTGFDVTSRSGWRQHMMPNPPRAGGAGGAGGGGAAGGGRAAGGGGAVGGGRGAGGAGGGGAAGEGRGAGRGAAAAAAPAAGAAPATPPPPTGPGFIQGVVARVDFDGRHMEVLGQNFRNPYEVAVDSWGNVWQTDNDDDGYAQTRLMYNMEGGNYGFRGPLNKTWTEDHGTHWHQEIPGVAPNTYIIGNGAPCGLLVYEGTLLPAKFRGQPFHADAGKRKLAMYAIEERGAGYEGRSEDVLNMGEDTWARPVDAAVAPDGAVFVADWYDPGVGGHLMGDPQGAKGRIYRIAPTGNKPTVPELNLTTDAGLLAALASPNNSRQFVAYRAIKALPEARQLTVLQAAWRNTDPIVRARALWMLGGLGEAGTTAIQAAMRSSDPKFRILGLRVAQANGQDMLAFSKPFLRDSSPAVRREIALMLQDRSRMLPPYLTSEPVPTSADRIDAIVTLAQQYDGRDRWYLEAIGIAARGREDAIYAKMKSGTAANQSASAAGVIWVMRPKSALPDLIATMNNGSATAEARGMAIDTVGNMQWPEATRAMETFILAAATPAPLAERAFNQYSRQLFSLWTEARTAPAFASVVRKAFTLPGAQAAAAILAADLNDPQFLPDLIAFAKSGTAAPDARAAAVEAVMYMRAADYVADFTALGDNAPAPVRVAAIRAAAVGKAPGLEAWAEKIVLSNAPNEVRVEALRAMTTTVAGLNAILDMADKKTLPAELRSLAVNLTNTAIPPPAAPGRRGAPQSPVTIRQRGQMPTDPAYIAIRERAARSLPMPAARRMPTSFEIDLNYGASVEAGKKVFTTDAACAACHSVGSGPKLLGPDLAKIGAKYGKQAMLDAIVTPSEGIQFEYIPTTLTLRNGDKVAGMIASETPTLITVQIGPNQQQRVNPADVASRQETRVSLMPEGLLDNLSLQQVADLLEYLASLK
jgi:putative membrane-bound dehydrogenase-like protein